MAVTESITKNRQDAATLRAMVARAFGPDQVVGDDEGWWEELGHGWFNVAYRLRLRDGRQVVVKIAPPPHVAVMTYEHGAMRIELDTIAMLRERTDVPVPDVLFVDQAHDLVDSDWFAMSFIEGEDLGQLAERVPAAQVEPLDVARGDITRRINAVTGPWFGPLAGPGFGTWREAFQVMVEDVLADRARRDVDTGWSDEAVLDVLAREADSLDEVTTPRLVEWDLWQPNVMVRDGQVVAIIDHERAFYGDPLIEAGFCGLVDPELGSTEAFLRGYGHAPLTPTQLRRRRLYLLHLLLIMVVETVYRGHTDSSQYDWARERLDALMTAYGHSRP